MVKICAKPLTQFLLAVRQAPINGQVLVAISSGAPRKVERVEVQTAH